MITYSYEFTGEAMDLYDEDGTNKWDMDFAILCRLCSLYCFEDEFSRLWELEFPFGDLESQDGC